MLTESPIRKIKMVFAMMTFETQLDVILSPKECVYETDFEGSELFAPAMRAILCTRRSLALK